MGVQEKKDLAEGPYGGEFMPGCATERKEHEKLNCAILSVIAAKFKIMTEFLFSRTMLNLWRRT
jgi:hypothetical protein